MTAHRAVVRGAAVAAPAVLLALVAAGCGSGAKPPAKTTTSGDRVSTLPSRTTPAPAAKPPAGKATTTTLKPPLAFVVHRRAQLRARPGGKVVGTIRTKTEFKSPTILSVAGRKPGWVLVRTSVEKHRVGWLPVSAGALFSQPRTIVIDLSRHRLSVFHRGRLTDTYKVAIGGRATPTPTGRFAVTDRLTTGNANGDYGCCILALTAHQPKIAQGWGGGDRVAIHATPHTWTLGQSISHGCVRASNQALRQLMRHARLGMPVTIHT
jgi:lipoprotein-anchoring transpeptidase ErfK/SrfK